MRVLIVCVENQSFVHLKKHCLKASWRMSLSLSFFCCIILSGADKTSFITGESGGDMNECPARPAAGAIFGEM